MEHLKAYILALKNMNTDFTIRIAQQSDALELMSLVSRDSPPYKQA